MTIKVFDSESTMGYTQQTTFFSDFSIADHFGINAIKDTYNRAFKEWKNDVVYITELTMVLNWKIWEWYEQNDVYANLYNDLWEKTDLWCLDNLKGEDLDYFYRTTR